MTITQASSEKCDIFKPAGGMLVVARSLTPNAIHLLCKVQNAIVAGRNVLFSLDGCDCASAGFLASQPDQISRTRLGSQMDFIRIL